MIKLKNVVFMFFLMLAMSCQKDDIESSLGQLNNEIEVSLRQVTLADWTPRPCVAITVFVEDDCHSNFSSNVGPAIDAYNTVEGLAINIVEVHNLPADIVVRCVDFGFGWDILAGLAEGPLLNGEIGNNLYLNTDYENECDDPCWYQQIIMHELSHNFGLFHNSEANGTTYTGAAGDMMYDPTTQSFTNLSPNASVTTMQIAGTPTGDQIGSIFNGNGLPSCGKADCTFSDADILALQSLYPLNDPCNCIEAIDSPCDCIEAFEEDYEQTCYCVCEYYNSSEQRWIEYRREEVSCVAPESCDGFTASTSRCTIENVCTAKEIVVIENPTSCSFCPCTSDSDCPSGFTCQMPNGGGVQICLPK